MQFILEDCVFDIGLFFCGQAIHLNNNDQLHDLQFYI